MQALHINQWFLENEFTETSRSIKLNVQTDFALQARTLKPDF